MAITEPSPEQSGAYPIYDGEEPPPPRPRSTDQDHADAQRIAFAPLFFQAVRTARARGVLDALAVRDERGAAIGDVVVMTRLSRYAAGLLVDACVTMGLAEAVHPPGTYRLTNVGSIFLRDTRVRVSTDFVHQVCHQGAYHLEQSLLEGFPAGLATLGRWNTIYEGVPELPEACRSSWYAFDHMYSDAVFPRAVRLLRSRGATRVLDIGGNTGRFAALAAATMDVTIVDHAAELRVARRTVDVAGVGRRVTTFPMELRSPAAAFPWGFDAVWLCQVLDCFPEEEIVSILERARPALVPGGRVYVVESFTDRQPTEAAAVALHGLSLYFAAIANGTSRMYASGDLIRCARLAGFRVAEDRTLGPWHTLLVLEP